MADGHINPATGVWDDNYWATHGGASNGSSSGGGTGDIVSSAKDLLKVYQEANQPAIQSLQASIPEIQSQFNQTVRISKFLFRWFYHL